MRSDLIDITVRVHAKTPKAVLVSESGDEKEAQWLPLSQIEVIETNKSSVVIVSIPEWLAIDKNFI